MSRETSLGDMFEILKGMGIRNWRREECTEMFNSLIGIVL